MGMCLALHAVSDQNIGRILSSPPLIWRLIAPEDPEIYLELTRRKGRGFFSRLFGKGENLSQEMPDLDFVDGEELADDLDKAWHGIHYCLNKTTYEAAPPMDFIVVGGTEVGDIEVGYGPARLFDSAAVEEINARISHITRDQLHRNYAPCEMTGQDIYPDIWEREGEEAFEYLVEYFDTLKTFVAHCNRNNLGMALYLS